jgi:hypothetical protein
MSYIKRRLASEKSSTGNYRASFDAMYKVIPRSVIKQANSSALAKLVDAIWSACQQSKGIAEREACDMDCIWDHRHNVMREIEPLNRTE